MWLSSTPISRVQMSQASSSSWYTEMYRSSLGISSTWVKNSQAQVMASRLK